MADNENSIQDRKQDRLEDSYSQTGASEQNEENRCNSTLRFAAGPQRIDLVPTESWQAASAVSHLAFEVDDLPALRGRLQQAELALVENRALPGYLRFYVKDPAGN